MASKAHSLADRYLLSYYEWCVAESHRELLSNYETLRRLANVSAQKYIAFMETLRPEFRARAALGIIRRYHPAALKLKMETLTSEDQQWIQSFLDFGMMKIASGIKTIPYKPDLNIAIARRSTLDRKRLRREVFDELAKQISCAPEPFSRSLWRFAQLDSGLILNTYIDFGGRIPLKYSQAVSDAQGKIIYRSSSVMQWHGITAATNWSLLTNELITQAAMTLADLCAKFDVVFRQLVARSINSAIDSR